MVYQDTKQNFLLMEIRFWGVWYSRDVSMNT